LEEYGYDLGLPLSSIKDRGRDTILLSTLDPNRDVQPQYLNYVIINIDGLSVTGMITSETATSITLTRAEGENDTVLRTHIDDMVNTGLSIMPEGLEEQVSKKEMVDLVEYLMEVP
jgi:putative heme-binding domain-containing protein